MSNCEVIKLPVLVSCHEVSVLLTSDLDAETVRTCRKLSSIKQEKFYVVRLLPMLEV